jgi:hypothetical protein
MDGIIKNPIIIGLLAGVITYAYLTYEADKNNKKKKHRKEKDKEEVNLLIPLAVAVIIWFISYAYFEYTPDSGPGSNLQNIYQNDGIGQMTGLIDVNGKRPMPLPIPPASGYRFVKDAIDESSDPKSFSLLTTGVNVPKNIPDVWLEMF